MTDSLKERLAERASDDPQSIIGKLLAEALARIEELEHELEAALAGEPIRRQGPRQWLR